MKIFLLTHDRELKRKTNTGQLVLDCLGDRVERIVWDRVNPNAHLVKQIQNNEIALMYPNKQSEVSNIECFENILIIDSTWQEANKIYNRSPYLHEASKVVLDVEQSSNYRLRRNQPEGGLCTAECIIQFLRIKQMNELADRLEQAFIIFNQQ